MRTVAAVVVVTVVAVVAAVVVACTVVVPPPVPLDTLRTTVDPLSTSARAGGFCATTWPAGCDEGTFCSCGLRPSFVSCVTAAPCLRPTSDGTTTGFTTFQTLRWTVVPFAAVTPAAGDRCGP